jgi:hypothetical protein
MCPRFVWVKLVPGDLAWCMMSDGCKLFYDLEAGANSELLASRALQASINRA